jgi:hypothetical protein
MRSALTGASFAKETPQNLFEPSGDVLANRLSPMGGCE